MDRERINRKGGGHGSANNPAASLRHRLLEAPDSEALLARFFFFFSKVYVSGKGVRNEGWASCFSGLAPSPTLR